jgi:hypothetical protein
VKIWQTHGAQVALEGIVMTSEIEELLEADVVGLTNALLWLRDFLNANARKDNPVRRRLNKLRLGDEAQAFDEEEEEGAEADSQMTEN